MQISRIRLCLSQCTSRNSKLHYSEQKILNRRTCSKVDPKVVALREKLFYCDHLDYDKISVGFKKRREMRIKQYKHEQSMIYKKLAYDPVFSVILDDKEKDENLSNQKEEEDGTNVEKENQKPIYMPYSRVDSYQTTDFMPEDVDGKVSTLMSEKYKRLREKYLDVKRSALQSENQPDFKECTESNYDALPKGELWKVPSNWMSDFEQYDETLPDSDWYKNYGTPDPLSQVSSVPCGGCGALLHCKDPAIPGYLPSELFLHTDNEQLKLTICQRCHFLKFYNASLEVKVSIEDYPKLLSRIKRKVCAILLIIDTTDFPCSIWPDLKSIMHPFTPIFLVGNKVDLLPRDSPRFFENVKEQLLHSVIDITGVKKENITHVALTSAKTGYGIEELISKLHHKWGYKGDVYLVGCTNVGKSSMFNALLNSDYCKVQAVDLVQRATTSLWPGTTLSLLKFPILNLTSEKASLRVERLRREQISTAMELKHKDSMFKMTRNMRYATLEGYIGKTFDKRTETEYRANPFSEPSHRFMERKLGLDESRPEYKQSRWCYDTPGTIQRDQILDLLTTDELLATLPQVIISPRTFILRPSETVFVAGMGRLDFVEGDLYIRCTLFTSEQLPITMCYTADADDLYNQLLGTEAFVVPVNDPERLKRWPKLESKEVKFVGIHGNESVADVVLSSVGWIAITAHKDEKVTLKAWTPEGRGIHVRTPALLKKAVSFRGLKIQGTPMYSLGKKVYVKVK